MGLAALLAVAASINAHATPWERVLGGARDERAQGLVALANGGWILLGATRTWTAGQEDAWVVCLDGMGDITWQKALGGAGADALHAGLSMSDGRVFLAGSTSSAGSGRLDGWLVALDAATGAVLWQRVIGDADDQELWDLAARPSGELWAVGQATSGSTDRDGLVVRFSGDGNALGTSMIGSSDGEGLAGIVSTASGARLVGTRDTTSGSGGWMLDLDDGAQPLQSRAVGSAGSALADVSMAPGGDLVAVGETINAGLAAGWIVVATPSGALREAPFGLGRASRLTGIGVGSDGRMHASGSECAGMQGCGVAGGADWDALVLDVPPPWTSLRFSTLGGRSLERGIAVAVGSDDIPVVLATTDTFGAGGSDLLAASLERLGLASYCSLTWDNGVALSFAPTNGSDFPVTSTPRAWPLSSATLAIADTDVVADGPCTPGSCPALTCELIDIDPNPPCADLPATLWVTTSGGKFPMELEWDLDGDGLTDATGRVITAMLGNGTRTITVRARDSCTFPSIQSCVLDLPIAPVTCRVPGEVSSVLLGEPPLLVRRGMPERVSFGVEPNATGYNVYSASIGTWYSPADRSCDDGAVMQDGPGRLAIDFALRGSAWVLVTASNPAGEGPAGATSLGVERTTVGAWSLCGAAP